MGATQTPVKTSCAAALSAILCMSPFREKRFGKGDARGAAEYFSKSVETDVRDFLEYGTAKAVMKALQKESSR